MEFIAGPEGLNVVDIESWRHFNQTDIVRYPDHQETYLRGPGLELACADAALFPGSDITKSYRQNYIRTLNGHKDADDRGS